MAHLALVALVASLLVVFPSTSAVAAGAQGGTTIVNEAFADDGPLPDGWVGNGVEAGQPRVIDGALQLTPNGDDGLEFHTTGTSSGDKVGSGNSIVYYDVAQSTSAGLDVTFTAAQYRNTGNPSAGLVFFLKDGDNDVLEPGQFPWARGYGPSFGNEGNSSGDGVDAALLGVGLEINGGFATSEGPRFHLSHLAWNESHHV